MVVAAASDWISNSGVATANGPRLLALRWTGALTVCALTLSALLEASAQAWTDREELPTEVVYADRPTGIALGPDDLVYVLSQADRSVVAYHWTDGQLDDYPRQDPSGRSNRHR